MTDLLKKKKYQGSKKSEIFREGSGRNCQIMWRSIVKNGENCFRIVQKRLSEK